MIDVSIICIFVIAHFLSDLASNKINSKEPYHSLSYMIVFFCCIILFLDAALALHFTLFEDGTAKSDNMETLLYKSWSVKDNKITFIVESIGNKTTSTDTIVQTIEKLTNDELLLVDGDIREAYKKAK